MVLTINGNGTVKMTLNN